MLEKEIWCKDLSKKKENNEMGLEDVASVEKDFAGDVFEDIQDMVVEIEEFSQNAMESLEEDVVEALENGDLKEALDCSDMPAEEKKTMKEVITDFLGTQEMMLLWNGISKMAIGSLERAMTAVNPWSRRRDEARISIYNGAKDIAFAVGLKSIDKEIKNI